MAQHSHAWTDRQTGGRESDGSRQTDSLAVSQSDSQLGSQTDRPMCVCVQYVAVQKIGTNHRAANRPPQPEPSAVVVTCRVGCLRGIAVCGIDWLVVVYVVCVSTCRQPQRLLLLRSE